MSVSNEIGEETVVQELFELSVLNNINCNNRMKFEEKKASETSEDSFISVINVSTTEEEAADNEDSDSVRRKNRLNSESDTADAESFRHFTREVLPRLNNYRNVMSLQASNRPTLDELHNPTYQCDPSSTLSIDKKIDTTESHVKFGWIQGVLVRCLLNIWGVMLFLRLSWVVAQAGICQAILLILTTSAVTTITALSMSAISTNGIIKGGGTYYMISRSLGPEFGGAIGLIFSLANAVACAMYVVGFCESMIDLLATFDLQIIDGSVQDVRIIGCITISLLTVIVIIGMEWEAKTQLILLVILLFAILDFIIGSIIGPTSEDSKAKGFTGYNIEILKENFYSDFRYAEGVTHNFFSVFAVFFPAATGILAGANISGDLKDPQSAIPKGTLLSIAITTASYILMALIVGFTVMRDASGNVDDLINGTLTNCTIDFSCKYGLHNSFQVIELTSWVGTIIYAGCFAATLSSALASLVSAPKVFQALCKDELYPYIKRFGKGYGRNDEPVRGYVLTFFIAIGFILIGQLNIIAPLISNFFLAAYTLINFSTFHASLAKPVGWRPTFKYYSMWLSLIGSVLCVVVMFLISWWTALVTFAAVIALYLIVSYRKPDVNWGSTTQAQTYKTALHGVYQLNNVEEHVKNYRPQILVLTGMPSTRSALVDFASLLTKNLSMLVCGHINTIPLRQNVRNALDSKANHWLRVHNMKAFHMQIDGVSFEEGAKALLKTCGIGKLKPNILLMGYKSNWRTCSKVELNAYFEILHAAFDLHMSVGILRLPQGLDCNNSTKVGEIAMVHTYKTFESSSQNKSSDRMPQASSSSTASTLSIGNKEVTNNNTNLDKKPKMQEKEGNTSDVPKQNITQEFQFQKKQKQGSTIDVWWLYDDGGLTLLLPYIINTRRSWSRCKLRVFALANKRDELELEQRTMASMLSKFRIDYSELHVIPNITSKAKACTQKLFDSLIANFRKQANEKDPDSVVLPEAELLATRDKTNRHLRLRELLLEHSNEASLIVMTLPVPRKDVVSAPLFMSWLELVTRDMPPILLVRGNQTSVLTFYS